MTDKWYHSREGRHEIRKKRIGAAMAVAIVGSVVGVIILLGSSLIDGFNKTIGSISVPDSDAPCKKQPPVAGCPGSTIVTTNDNLDGGSTPIVTGAEQTSSPTVRDNKEVSKQPLFDIPQSTGSSTSENPKNLTPEGIAMKIHMLVNEHREDSGLAQLSYDDELASIAEDHSRDMVENDFFSHDNPAGLDPSGRAERSGYSCFKELGDGFYTEGIGENIAQNYLHDGMITYLYGVEYYAWLTEEQLAKSIFTQWKNSPGHNANMLEKNYDREGLGLAIGSNYEIYATQNFC